MNKPQKTLKNEDKYINVTCLSIHVDDPHPTMSTEISTAETTKASTEISTAETTFVFTENSAAETTAASSDFEPTSSDLFNLKRTTKSVCLKYS